MASATEKGGKLLALGLVTFLIVEVIISANKLSEGKMSVSTTTGYEEKRLMPSISVCFEYKGFQNGTSLRATVQSTLNDARQVDIYQQSHTIYYNPVIQACTATVLPQA